jgi:hypothetical protein
MVIMFLRHIQLIFSSQLKTLKLGKCFVARNKFPDKLACCFGPFYCQIASMTAASSLDVPQGSKVVACLYRGMWIFSSLLSTGRVLTIVGGRAFPV